MRAKNGRKESVNEAAMPRTSVSFPPEMYKTLEEIASKKKVSIGWVVRDAVEKYLGDAWPLFAGEVRQQMGGGR